MMQKTWIGNTAIIILALTNIVLWVVFLPPAPEDPIGYKRHLMAEIISSTAMVLMACALFLSTRPRYLESFFGGLDKMYHAHKNAGLAALLLVVAHFLVMPIGVEVVGAETEIPMTFAVSFLQTLSVPPGVLAMLGETLGLVAFAGLLLLVLLTVAPRLPLIGRFTRVSYNKWQITHKFIGLFFVIGFIRALTLRTPNKMGC